MIDRNRMTPASGGRGLIDPDRVTDRVSFATLRLELRRSAKPLVILAVGLIIAIVTGSYILSGINGGIGSTHTMQFEVADATGVVPGRGEVRFEGIEAGLITGEKFSHGHAVLTASVADKFGPVYRNASAEVRPNTPLQDMYLDIVNRGTRTAGTAGSNYVVPISQTESPVNLADVLDAFQPDVRSHMYELIDQLGNGLQDRGAALRQAFVDLEPFVQVAGNVSRQLAVRSTLTKQVVHNTSALSALLASRSTQIRQLVSTGTATLRALSTEGGEPLRATIAQLPPTFAVLAPTLRTIDALLPSLNGAIGHLEPVADVLPSGLKNLRALAVSADPAVRRLRVPVAKLVPLADQLHPFAGRLSGTLTALSPQIADVNALTLAGSECTKQLNAFFDWDASFSKFFDGVSTTARGNANFGFYSDPPVKPANFTYAPQCAGGAPIADVPVPKYDGPAPAP
jgi:ABC-type transporter Mla subunit MlaD